MIYIDIKTKCRIMIIQEINPTTVKVRRVKDNKVYIMPKNEVGTIKINDSNFD